MKLTLKMGTASCSPNCFELNCIDADCDDFGEHFDRGNYEEDACCTDMRFTRKEPTSEVIDKYGISEEEYDKVCDELEDKMSYGRCSQCERVK